MTIRESMRVDELIERLQRISDNAGGEEEVIVTLVPYTMSRTWMLLSDALLEPK